MLDERNFRFYGKNKIIELSVNETYFLSLLINKNRIVTYEEIAFELFDLGDDKYTRKRIATFVCRLKAKLKDEVVIKSKTRFWILYREIIKGLKIFCIRYTNFVVGGKKYYFFSARSE